MGGARPARMLSASRASGDDFGMRNFRDMAQNSAVLTTASVVTTGSSKPPAGATARPDNRVHLQILSSTPTQSSGGTYGGIVRTAPARRAGSASIASSSEMANSASFKAEAELLDDTNDPDVPSW